MKLAWITDPHFDSASKRKLKLLGYRLTAESYDALLITGDLSNGKPVKYLHRLRRFFSGHVFFVLGNHDMYGADIVDREIELSHHKLPKAIYLTRALPLELTKSVGLVGDDGWYDARNGKIDLAITTMQDFGLVGEVRRAVTRAMTARPEIREVVVREDIAAIADRAIARLKPKLEEAVTKYRTVLVLTHFPPFEETANYFGENDKYYLPFYSSKAMGDLLYRTALEHPETRIITLCGHVHCENFFQPADNLEVYSGYGDYTRLFIHRTLHLDDAGVRFETPEQQEIAPSPVVDNS